jgi:hypothetical protein
MGDQATGPSSAATITGCRLARALTISFIVVTAALSLLWSHAKLMSQDEMYEFQTDSVRSLAELVHVQRTWPISLDPLLYHALSHGAMTVFGADAFAQRFPAFLGFLLMQVCLFFFVRNLAGERAGAVAAAFPALTATLFYSAEGRPYGLLLGLYALALLCWQMATRGAAAVSNPTSDERLSDMGHPRWLALVGLALALAATINTHYFGVLLLVPICAGEAYRTLARRRVDWPVWSAIVVGMAGVVATKPFFAAANEFKKNYYNGGAVGLHDITRAYRSIFVEYTHMSMRAQHLWMGVLVIFALGLVLGCALQMLGSKASSREGAVPAAEWVAILALAALPFCGYLMARFVTHTIEVRYVLGALVAISAMLAVAIAPWLRRDGTFAAVMTVLFLAIVGSDAARIHTERQRSVERLASLVLPANVKQALLANPDGRLYIQDMGAFEEDRPYEPDPEIQARMTLVYSSDKELRWNRHDTMALTAMHMQHFAGVPVVSYEALKTIPGEHIFLMQHSGWDWTDQAFAEDAAQVQLLGEAMGGDIAAVKFLGE